MRKRDIDRYNNEQIHEIGAIQDIGFVIAVKSNKSNSEFKIVAISDNVVNAPWTGSSSVEEFLDRSIDDIFDARTGEMLKELIVRFQSLVCHSDGAPYARNFALVDVLSKGSHVTVAQTMLCCSVVGCSNPDTFILEFEENCGNQITSNAKILRAGDIVERIRSADSILAVTASFVNSVMESMLGYDRGMVYCFGNDMCGSVIHEFARDHLKSSYLNLRFPAEDIPVPVRKIFVKNGLRFIYSVVGEDSKIGSSEPEKLDLTMCSLRACSKCHTEYLRNMGVVSSMSVSIVVNENLWGLYAFHSYTHCVKPTVEERIMLEMAASITAMKIDAFQREKHALRKLEANQIMMVLQNSKSLHEFLLMYSKKILEIIEADTIAVYEYDGTEGKLAFGDITILPTAHGYTYLSEECATNSHLEISNFTDGLSGSEAGVLFFKHQFITVAFIRKCKVSDVRWAGKPDRVHDESASHRLRPRTSFELYMEQGRLESIPWTTLDIDVAIFFMDRIDHFLHSEMLASFRLSLDQSNFECFRAIESAHEHHEFFAHMSHELRTPFHGVISSLQILAAADSEIDEDERQELIESALDCGETMLQTLNDILTIAKSKTYVEVTKKPFVLNKIAASTLRTSGPAAQLKQISLRHEMEKSLSQELMDIDTEGFPGSSTLPIVVLGDETRLVQIANNLTNNAIKFSGAGGTVTIRTHVVTSMTDVWKIWNCAIERFSDNFILDATIRQKQEENVAPQVADIWYVFEVEDAGCGVSGIDMKTSFDAYKQLSSGVSKTYQGTGLGLHICRLHIELMNGLIGVTSTLGKGAVFLFAIPMAVDKEGGALISATDSTHLNHLLNSPTENKDLHRCKESMFLIVDDSSINLRLTKRKLQLAFGDRCTILTAEDGFVCISTYQELIETGKQPLLNGIFMDYHMPRCSGLEAIQQIRKIEELQQNINPVYIAALTGDVTESGRKELMDAGANEVLPKPLPAGHLESLCIHLVTTRT